MEKNKSMSLSSFILMILTSIFGVVNIGIGFQNVGYAAIPWYLIGGFLFFLPFAFMMIEFSTAFKDAKGGIYTWMSKSVSIKFAFSGIMMWYASYIIWMFGKAVSIWIPLSFAIYGEDKTDQIGSLYLGMPHSTPTDIAADANMSSLILSIAGVLFVVLVAYLITLGTKKFAILSSIGGFAVILLNLTLLIGGIIAIIVNHGHLATNIEGIQSFFIQKTDNQTNFSYIFSLLSFLVFAIFAYGGIEAIAGAADQIEKPEKNLKKGIIISVIFTIFFYVVGFLMVGSVTNYTELSGSGKSGLSALYFIMQNLGVSIGNGLHLGANGAALLGDIIVRIAGIGMFVTYMGAFIALTYAPLKQLVDGTPKEFWPKAFQKHNKEGIPITAVIVQAVIVIFFVLLKGIVPVISAASGAEVVKNLFDAIINMGNIAMTLPYLFLIYAYYKFRKNDNLEKGLILLKKKWMVLTVTMLTFVSVSIANLFNVIRPMVEGYTEDGNTFGSKFQAGADNAFWMVIGPILFGGIALIIYRRNKRKGNVKDN